MKKESAPLEVKKEKLNIKEAPLILSAHALERFEERWQPFDEFDLTPENEEEWREKLEFLVRDSEEVMMGNTFKIKRLISNDYEDARYFYNKVHNLRFITVEEGGFIVVKTVEIPKKRKK